MDILPGGITHAIEELSKLPSIGPKTAERLVFYMLKGEDYQQIGESILQLKDDLHSCEICKNFATESRCQICTDPRREQQSICVVSQPLDIVAIEKTGLYRGTYHVLHGVISPVEGIGPEDLELQSFFTRVQTVHPDEIILATNPNLEGETTALYISKKLEDFDGKITKLAHGLPIGSDVEYADQMTLGRALDNRLSF